MRRLLGCRKDGGQEQDLGDQVLTNDFILMTECSKGFTLHKVPVYALNRSLCSSEPHNIIVLLSASM